MVIAVQFVTVFAPHDQSCGPGGRGWRRSSGRPAVSGTPARAPTPAHTLSLSTHFTSASLPPNTPTSMGTMSWVWGPRWRVRFLMSLSPTHPLVPFCAVNITSIIFQLEFFPSTSPPFSCLSRVSSLHPSDHHPHPPKINLEKKLG